MSVSMAIVAVLVAVQPALAELPARLISPSCIACEVDAEELRRAYSPEQWQSIKLGQIITSEIPHNGSGNAQERRVQATAIFRKPPQNVWAVIADFPSRPEYVPSIDEMRIIRVDGKRVWVDESLTFFLFNIRNQVINVLEPRIGSLSWVLDKSADNDIDDTTGRWQLAPLAKGAHTLVIYRVYVDSGQAVPDFIERYLVESSVPKLLEQVRDEVARRFPD